MSSRSNGVMKLWFSLVKMLWVISSPSCSMALTICTCSGTPVKCESILSRALAPTWIFAACFAKRSKKPSSRGKNRCKSPGICDSPLKSLSQAKGRYQRGETVGKRGDGENPQADDEKPSAPPDREKAGRNADALIFACTRQ